MTKRFKKIFLVIIFLCSIPVIAIAEQSQTVRELIAASENIKKILPIDSYNTFIAPKTHPITGDITSDFSNELLNICYLKGGKIEVTVTVEDPITGKEKTVWKEIRIGDPWNYKNVTLKFDPIHLVGEYHGKFRCANLFEITNVYGAYLHSSYAGVTTFTPKTLILRTTSPQPTIIKTENLKSPELIKLPADGELSNSIPEVTYSFLFSKLYDKPVVFSYLTLLCEKYKGTPKYIIKPFVYDKNTRRFKELPLKEESNLKAFDYIFRRQDCCENRTEWYIACSGNTKFIAKGTYDSRSIYFANNRDASELNYTPLENTPTSLTSGVTDNVIVAQKIEEKIAIEAANRKNNFLKVYGSQEYTGIYNGQDQEECDLVSVTKNWDTSSKNPRIDTYNYRICRGAIVKTSETSPELLPRDINIFIQRIAKVAQKLGKAEGEYQGYTVKAQAMRDKDQCLVEIKILKDINLIEEKIINSCQQNSK